LFCPKCGAQNDNEAQFCSRCAQPLTAGTPANPPTPGTAPEAGDRGVGALGILFFCIPLVGAIMYFVWKDEKPAQAKQACTLALWGTGVGILLQVLVTLLGQ
jgi:zinc-ribbon domain